MSFDPYHKWLGIPPNEQPPNLYRLLAIPLFEPDADVIDAAADGRMTHLRTFSAGKNGPLAQKLLNEISAARVTLLNPQTREAYDGQLRAQFAAAEAARAQHAMYVQPPVPVAVPPTGEMAGGFAAPAAPAFSLDAAPYQRSRSKGGSVLVLAVIGLLAIGGTIGAAWYVLNRTDGDAVVTTTIDTPSSDGTTPPNGGNANPTSNPGSDATGGDAGGGSNTNSSNQQANNNTGGQASGTNAADGDDSAAAPNSSGNPDKTGSGGSSTIASSGQTSSSTDATATAEPAAIAVAEWKGHSGPVLAVAFSGDGRFAASAGEDKTVHIWDVELGRPVKRFEGMPGVVQHVRLSSDGKTIAVAIPDDDQLVRIWHADRPTQAVDLRTDWMIHGFDFSADGSTVVVGGEKQFEVFNAKTGLSRGKFDFAGTACAVFSSGERIAAAGDSNVIRLFEPPANEPYGELPGGKMKVNAVAVSADERVLVSGGPGMFLIVWDVEGKRAIQRIKVPGAVRRVAMNGDGKRCTSLGERFVSVWDVPEAKQLFSIKQASACGPAISADGRKVLTGDNDGIVRLISLPPVSTKALPTTSTEPEEEPEQSNNTVFLADLEPSEIDVMDLDGTKFRGKGMQGEEGRKIVVGGQPSPNGLGTHPPSDGTSRLVYDLNGEYERLTGGVAINDSAKASRTPIVFEVKGDTRTLWRSVPIQRGGVAHPFFVDVRGVRKLEIAVHCPGPYHDAHAVWVEPTLTRASPRTLGDLANARPIPRDRQPAPETSAVETATKTLQEIHPKAESKPADEQLELARKVLQIGRSSSDPAEQFASFQFAAEMARRGGDARLVLEALGEIDLRFQVDALAMQARELTAMAKGAKDEASVDSLASVALLVAERAIAKGKIEEASDLVDAVTAVAQRPWGKRHAKVVVEYRTSLAKVKKAWQSAEAARTKLEADADDAQANLELGRWTALELGDWKEGAKLLAKGSDENLKRLAELDLAADQGGPREQLAAADALYQAAEQASESDRTALYRRAGHWYATILPMVKQELAKAKYETRLAEIAKLPSPATAIGPEGLLAHGKWMSVLGLTNLNGDALGGAQWEQTREQISTEQPQFDGRFMLPVRLKGSYEFEFDFTAPRGQIAVWLPLGDRGCQLWIAEGPRGVSGLVFFRDIRPDRNPTLTPAPKLDWSKRHSALVRVQQDSDEAIVEVEVDGKPHLKWKGRPDQLSGQDQNSIRDTKTLALGSRNAPITFHFARVKPITGIGRLIAPIPGVYP